MVDSETVAALRRAGRRALFHLLKAGVEGLKAVEVIVDELGRVGHYPDDAGDAGSGPRRERIEVE